MTRQPRILMFVPQYPYPVVGGLERQSHELARTLVTSLNVPVQVLSGKIIPNQPSTEVVEGVPVTRVHWSSWKALRFFRSPVDIFWHLWRKRNDYDVVHLHQHSSVGLFVIVISKILRKPVITKLPNIGDFGIPGIRHQPFGQIRLPILLRSNAIIAMSDVSFKELQAVGYPREQILSVPNGIMKPLSLNRVCQDSEPQACPCRVVFVGRLSAAKSIDTLLSAWVKVQSRILSDAYLELWGEGPDSLQLKKMSVDLGIADSVTFRGYVDNVRSHLRDMDIFVLPSKFEGNSNSILEAMAAALPIVATPVGGAAIQVGPLGAPLLFPVGDVDELVERLILLIEDAELRRTYGAAMQARVAKYFDIEGVAKSYLCAYRMLTSGRSIDLSLCGELPSHANP